MADHLDAPGLMSPNMDARIDVTDIYELKIDTNGDAVADIAYRVRFSDPALGPQTAMVHRATGAAAAGANDGGPIIVNGALVDLAKTSTPTITSSGGYKFYAGIRSDPFFF